MTDDLVVGTLGLDDVPELLDMFRRYDLTHFGEPLMDADDLHTDLSAPDLDLAVDTLALRTPDGTLVGAGYVSGRGHLDVQYAEGWEELQAGLVDFGEQRGRARGLSAVFTFVAAGDTDRATWLMSRGYELGYTSWILHLDPETPIAGRTLPPGYAVRPFTLDDAEATFAVVRDAFAEWETGPERTFAGWRADALERPNVDPSFFRVATYRGEVVGSCIVYDAESEAWVSYLAVAKPHRGQGVAQQLLADAYAAARDRGLPHAGLSTDTRSGALDLYLRLGMRVLFTLDNYRLDLSG